MHAYTYIYILLILITLWSVNSSRNKQCVVFKVLSYQFEIFFVLITIALRIFFQENPFRNYIVCKLVIILSYWRRQMETFSELLALCEGNPSMTGRFPSQRPVTELWRFLSICVWTNRWSNHRDARDLRRHPAHYDVTAMVQATMYLHFVTRSTISMTNKRANKIIG